MPPPRLDGLYSIRGREYNADMDEAKQIQKVLLEVARKCASQGPGFAQESVVLREAAEQLKIQSDMQSDRDLTAQQRLLNAWHDLFRTGKLYWGYDIDNPGQPFFHFPENAAIKVGAG